MRNVFLLLFILFTVTKVFAQEYTLNNNATKDACNCYTLTTAAYSQKGSVWNNNKIDLNQPFDFVFNINFGCNDLYGADGMAFVLQPIGTNVGGQGGGMGFSGVSPSVGVTLDDFQNGEDKDPAYDHIDIQYNGIINHPVVPPRISATSDNVEDCNWHLLRVKWDPSIKKITSYFDGAERISATKDIVKEIFNGDSKVYWGFTGATGGYNNKQQFCTALSPNFYFLNPKKCIGDPISFLDSTQSFSAIKSWEWDFGDGSTVSHDKNPIHTYSIAKDYIVKLTVEGADLCKQQISKTISVGSFPVADFATNSVCANVDAAFTDKSVGQNIDKWNWDLGFGISAAIKNPTQSYKTLVNGSNNTVKIKLTVITKEGCASPPVEKDLKFYAVPVTDFIQTPGCENFASVFTDKSGFTTQDASINGTITKWDWNFEAGIVSSQQNPTVALAAANTKATLITTTSNGCISDAVTKTILPPNKPKASFTIDANQKFCINTAISFTDASQAGAIIKYEWNFGDGNINNSGNASPAHTYVMANTYTVSLAITNVTGCSDTIQKQITITDKPPIPSFTVANSCADKTVSFTGTSNGGSISKWNWNLGFGATATQQNPTKLYSALVNGTNNDVPVSLSVTNNEGCVSDPATGQLKIYSLPVAKFSQTAVCVNTGVEYRFKDESFFTGTNASINGTITKWNWDFGAGIHSNQQDTSLILDAAINKTATLKVVSSNGCESIPISNPIPSAILPVVDFETGNICESAPVELIDKSKTLNGSAIINWQWNLGNGQQSVDQKPKTTYPSTGTAAITLTVKDANGCSSGLTKTVIINALPQAIIAAFGQQLCENKPVQLTDASTTAAGTNINNWSWTIDNANPVINQNLVGYFGAGNHTVKLAVKNNIGCESTPVQTLFTVKPKPGIDYSFPVSACKNATVQFAAINNSTEIIDKWFWKFGDNSTANTQLPSHSYTNNKTFKVELYALSANGCYSDTLNNKPIIIYGTDVFAGDDIIATFNQPVQLKATGGESYKWSPAIGLNDINIANPIATLTQDQTYTVTANTLQGCESSDEISIKIYKGPEIYVPSAFSPDGNGTNDIFKAIPAGIVLFEEFSVYNRYGQLLFTTNDYNKGWDGRYKGQPQNIGVYVWVARGIDFRGNKIARKGTVMLTR